MGPIHLLQARFFFLLVAHARRSETGRMTESSSRVEATVLFDFVIDAETHRREWSHVQTHRSSGSEAPGRIIPGIHVQWASYNAKLGSALYAVSKYLASILMPLVGKTQFTAAGANSKDFVIYMAGESVWSDEVTVSFDGKAMYTKSSRQWRELWRLYSPGWRSSRMKRWLPGHRCHQNTLRFFSRFALHLRSLLSKKSTIGFRMKYR